MKMSFVESLKHPILKKIIPSRGFFKKPLFYFGGIIIIFSLIFILKGIFRSNQLNSLLDIKESLSCFSEKNIFLEQKNKARLASLVLLQKNTLSPIAAPAASFKSLGAMAEENAGAGSFSSAYYNKEIKEYFVEKGDTLLGIAQKFGVSLDSILWANNLRKDSVLQSGQKLVILPVSGVLHYVQKGDTLEDIAKKYKADLSEIISFNELSSPDDIHIGDALVVPGGTMPKKKYVQQNSLSVPLADNYFIIPVSSPYVITQGLHWRNAVDFSHSGNACGKPIYAAAQGKVLKVRYGWNMGAGNYVTILHPNGVVTMYGHLQTILVKVGDLVSQGQIIALMGGKPGTPGAGRSTGCHLHFGVYGARNPFAP